MMCDSVYAILDVRSLRDIATLAALLCTPLLSPLSYDITYYDVLVILDRFESQLALPSSSEVVSCPGRHPEPFVSSYLHLSLSLFVVSPSPFVARRFH